MYLGVDAGQCAMPAYLGVDECHASDGHAKRSEFIVQSWHELIVSSSSVETESLRQELNMKRQPLLGLIIATVRLGNLNKINIHI